MCAQYLVKANQSEISSQFEVQSSDDVPQQWSHYRVLPFRSAPIVCVKDGIRCLQEMRFHLTPKWSKTEKVKWATYNARLETIHEKASFKESFKKRRCLVLVSKFIEPVYEGEWAGHMVRFFDDNNGVLPAAGIYDEWINPPMEAPSLNL